MINLARNMFPFCRALDYTAARNPSTKVEVAMNVSKGQPNIPRL